MRVVIFCSRYQQMLHRNLVYLASIADANQNIQALLPVSSQFSFYDTRYINTMMAKLMFYVI